MTECFECTRGKTAVSTSLVQQKEEKALARFSCEWMALISMEFSCLGQREFDAFGSDTFRVKLGSLLSPQNPAVHCCNFPNSGGGVKAIVEIYSIYGGKCFLVVS